MDSHGRVFYIDHATRTTSWTRPGGNSSSSPESIAGAEQHHRRQLDRRYQSIRRTISSNRLENVEANSLAPPGCKLLTRPDFFTILHMNQVRNLLNFAYTNECLDIMTSLAVLRPFSGFFRKAVII